MPNYLKDITDEVIINPAGTGEGVVDVPVHMKGLLGKLTIGGGKKIKVKGNVKVIKF